jgi:hypothetical protein
MTKPPLAPPLPKGQEALLVQTRELELQGRAAIASLRQAAERITPQIVRMGEALTALNGRLAHLGLLGGLEAGHDAFGYLSQVQSASRGLERIVRVASNARGEGRVWHCADDVPQDEPGLIIRDAMGDEAARLAPLRWRWSLVDHVELPGIAANTFAWKSAGDVYFPVVEVLG